MSDIVVVRRSHLLAVAALVLLALAVAIPVFLRLSDPANVISDIPRHALLAPRMVSQGGWISYSLWYPLLFLSAGGSTDPSALQAAAVVLLTIAVVAKVVVAYVIAWRWSSSRIIAVAAAVVLLFAMPIVNPLAPSDIYLGQISATVWHNSTNILVAPFALVAFAAAVSLLRNPTVRTGAVCGGLALLVVLMKPNYLIALLPVLGIMLLCRLHSERTAWRRRIGIVACAFLPATLMLAVQYGLVFAGGGSVRDTTLGIAPLTVWQAFSDNIPLSLVLSLLGPVVVLVVLPAAARRSPATVLAWGVLVVAIVQLALLAEIVPDGSIDLDGNFFWGSFTAMAVVLLVSVVELGRANPRWPSTSRARATLVVAIAMIGLHVASGIVYVLLAGVGDFPVV